ncbi:DUF2625 family protein [Streptomyces sp. NPDC001571]
MRGVHELINVGGPAWPALFEELSGIGVPVEVLPVDAEVGCAGLQRLQVSARSHLGGIVLICGGLLVDSGWLCRPGRLGSRQPGGDDRGGQHRGAPHRSTSPFRSGDRVHPARSRPLARPARPLRPRYLLTRHPD